MRSGIFNPILFGKRLFQKFAINTYNKIESSWLDFIRNNQQELGADVFKVSLIVCMLVRAVLILLESV